MAISEIWLDICYDLDLIVSASSSGEKQLKMEDANSVFQTNLNWDYRKIANEKNELVKRHINWRELDYGSKHHVTLMLRKLPLNELKNKRQYFVSGYSHKIYILGHGELEKFLEDSKKEFIDLAKKDNIQMLEEKIYHALYFVSQYHTAD